MMTSSGATAPAAGFGLFGACFDAFAGDAFLCVNGIPALRAFAIPPLSAHLDRLSFELIKCGVKSAEKISMGTVADQFVVVIRNRYLDIVGEALMGENDMRLGLASPVIQKLAYFVELGCQLQGLLG